MEKKFKKHLIQLTRIRTSQGRDIESGLCLDRNERVTPIPSNHLKAIQKLILSPLLSCYPESARLYKRLSHWLDFPEEQIYITNGITEGIHFLYETLANPHDRVVVVDPTYPMYNVYGKIHRVEYCPVGFHQFELNLNQLYDSINDRTAFVVVPNPNLPMEYCLNLSEIKKIAKKCLEHNTFLVIDEAYGFFGADSAKSLIHEFENLIICQTLSKAFGLAGIRVGFLLSNKENIEYLSKTRPLNESNAVSMAIAEYMIEHKEIMEDYVEQTKQGRDYIRAQIDRMGLKWYGGDYTNAMLIFLETNEQVKEAVSFLKNKKIYVRASFDPPLDQAIRLTLGPKESMNTFLKAFESWYQQKMAGVGGEQERNNLPGDEVCRN